MLNYRYPWLKMLSRGFKDHRQCIRIEMLSSTQSYKQPQSKPPHLLLGNSTQVASYTPTHSPDFIIHGKYV